MELARRRALATDLWRGGVLKGRFSGGSTEGPVPAVEQRERRDVILDALRGIKYPVSAVLLSPCPKTTAQPKVPDRCHCAPT